jgi:hypothetical protein
MKLNKNGGFGIDVVVVLIIKYAVEHQINRNNEDKSVILTAGIMRKENYNHGFPLSPCNI